MKILRTIILLVVLLISATWGRDYLAQRAERNYFKGLVGQVHEGMDSGEAVDALNTWMTDHPQRGGAAMKPGGGSDTDRGEMEKFILNGSHGCALEVTFDKGAVAEIFRSGF